MRTDEKFEFPAPRPWRLEGETIRDREGVVVMSALNPANMEMRRLIVEAVNERDRLRDLVRRMIPSVEAVFEDAKRTGAAVNGLCALRGVDSGGVDEILKGWSSLLREAREAVEESMKDGVR